MKTKIVYVLVSNRNDYYTEMLQLSLYSLRLYHPHDVVEIVMDEDTHRRLMKRRSPLLTEANPIIVNVPDCYSSVQRSRYLKTSLREILSGDFLFIDTDTVIGGSLRAIEEGLNESIAAVLDNHDGEIVEVQRLIEPKNWSVLYPVKQFNSGVFYVRDTAEAHRFFLQWHENWKYCVSNGCNYDQPGLRKALQETDIHIEELSGIWNCQVSRPSSMEFQKDAVIMHYQRAGFFVSKVCREIRKAGKVCGEAEALAKSPRIYFSGQTLFLTQMEFAALSSLRRTLFDHPRFFAFLSKLADRYSFIVAFLYNVKQRVVRLIKR